MTWSQGASFCPALPYATCAGSHGGTHVEVEGSFDNWTTRQPLQRSGKDFTIIKLLPPGVYQVRVVRINRGRGLAGVCTSRWRVQVILS